MSLFFILCGIRFLVIKRKCSQSHGKLCSLIVLQKENHVLSCKDVFLWLQKHHSLGDPTYHFWFWTFLWRKPANRSATFFYCNNVKVFFIFQNSFYRWFHSIFYDTVYFEKRINVKILSPIWIFQSVYCLGIQFWEIILLSKVNFILMYDFIR